MQIVEANEMIREGQERRAVLQEELALELVNERREKITIRCNDDKYRTFKVVKIKAQNKIKVNVERE